MCIRLSDYVRVYERSLLCLLITSCQPTRTYSIWCGECTTILVNSLRLRSAVYSELMSLIL